MKASMKHTSSDDPVLPTVRNKLQAVYGERLEGALLFGSRARGDHGPESDYDVAVLLSGYDYTMVEVNRLAELSWDIQAETGAIVSFKPVPSRKHWKDTVLSRAIERDGVAL